MKIRPETAVRLERRAGWLVYRLHKFLYRITAGRIGRNTDMGPIILLTHTGAKSGKTYVTPLLGKPEGDGWIVVGSNAGREEDPAWIHNVRANPQVEVQDGRHKYTAEASILTGERRQEVWDSLGEQYEGWYHYQTLTDREIKVVELRPAKGPEE